MSLMTFNEALMAPKSSREYKLASKACIYNSKFYVHLQMTVFKGRFSKAYKNRFRTLYRKFEQAK